MHGIRLDPLYAGHERRLLPLKELQEVRSVEALLVETLPEMHDMASSDELQQLLKQHLDDTRSHLEHAKRLLAQHDVTSDAHADRSMRGLVAEGKKWALMLDDPALRDALLAP